MRYTSEFYQLPTLELASTLLGKKLCTLTRGVLTSGTIVEVEAYHGIGDAACHAARGKTPRTSVMFKSPGHCYVYFIYGMYYCVNVVSEEEGIGSAVLIRAIEPIDGIETMMRRRKKEKLHDLASGPGKLCQALGITPTMSGEHLSKSKRIWIEPHLDFKAPDILRSPRIGISEARDFEWRFFLKENPFVSRTPKGIVAR